MVYSLEIKKSADALCVETKTIYATKEQVEAALLKGLEVYGELLKKIAER
jgi:hypothetical protein